MGMFDSIYAAVKCPVCCDERKKELQTKDLRCNMDRYDVGDSIGTTQYRWLDCHVSCQSESCHKDQEARDGYRSGFGYVWQQWAEIDDVGRITGRFVDEIPLSVQKTEKP